MTESQAYLTRPSERYKDSFIAAVYEYIREKRTINWHPEILRTRFEEYLRVLEQAETEPLAGYAPASRFWLIADGDGYIGDVDVRHCLNESLKRYGGHIGYKIRPTFRQRGHGTLICKLGIEQVRLLGISDILITCDDDNIGSAKIIEANGGFLRDRVDNGRGVLTRRYWIRAGD